MTAPGEWIIVRRELRGSLTRWRHVLAVTVWLAMTSLITYARWPQDFSNPQAYRTEAQYLLLGQCLIMILALSMTIPALAVSTLTREHEQETFDQMRLTPLQAETIARGKMFTSAFFKRCRMRDA